jgi:hypothetical protein
MNQGDLKAARERAQCAHEIGGRVGGEAMAPYEEREPVSLTLGLPVEEIDSRSLWMAKPPS